MLLVWRPFTGTSAVDGHIESGGKIKQKTNVRVNKLFTYISNRDVSQLSAFISTFFFLKVFGHSCCHSLSKTILLYIIFITRWFLVFS